MNDIIASILLMGALGGGGDLPFWMSANQFGLMPQTSGGLALVQAYKKPEALFNNTLTYSWGVSAGANFTSNTSTALLDEIYGSIGWKKLSLDLGMKHPVTDFNVSGLGSLSTTGGHLLWTGNSRTLPGYLLNLSPVEIPKTKGHLLFYGAFGDYKAYGENRYVPGVLIHSTKLFLKAKVNDRLSFDVGLDHSATWGGSGDNASVKVTLSNYLRVLVGAHAGADGNGGDQINVIGDQRGGELFKLNYAGRGWKLTAQHEIPYDDGSAMMFYNFPDGINTICFSFDDKNKWVSDILYEFSYTMYQSGPINRNEYDDSNRYLMPEDADLRGGDDYFTNYLYWDGWTLCGRTIGYPLFFASEPDNAGCVRGVSNNRLIAHHFGIGGKLFRKAPYKLMVTVSDNFGRYKVPYKGESVWLHPWGSVKEEGLWQFSAAFMGEVPFRKGLTFTYGLYADKGQVLKNQIGATLGIRVPIGMLLE